MRITRSFTLPIELAQQLQKEENQSATVEAALYKHYSQLTHKPIENRNIEEIQAELEEALAANKAKQAQEAIIENLPLAESYKLYLKKISELPKKDLELIEQYSDYTGERYPLELKPATIREAHNRFRQNEA